MKLRLLAIQQPARLSHALNKPLTALLRGTAGPQRCELTEFATEVICLISTKAWCAQRTDTCRTGVHLVEPDLASASATSARSSAAFRRRPPRL